ncbi:MAG TPA: CaiB/BaiF CoA-transferase family protein [Thermomicrobiaceae bacterium]|nr:CaiB/BaiF CoA-transferase family protein [Thermomicrobiaceae bacterium]
MAEPALSGIKVLAFEQAAAGPFATHILADMGAEVIKVERPGSGDVVRGWDRAVHGLSSGFVWLSRRKRSITVDAKTPEGQAVLRRLAEQADVFLTNFAPGVAESLGLGYAELAAANPRLIYCALTGYGLSGPYRDAKAYDLLIQGEAGVLATTGYPDAPAKVGLPISDIAAGMYAALGIVLALYQRDRSGRGQLVDVAMFDAILSWLGYFPHHYWHQGEEAGRAGMRHHYIVPYGPYLARDGRYVNAVVASPRDWETFCTRVLSRPDLLQDQRFSDSPARRENRAELEALIEQLFLERDSEEWFARLEAAGLPHGALRGIAEVLAHPQVAARRLVREVDSPVGRVPTVESALRLSQSPVAEGPIPALGGDTAAVLREAGYRDDEIAALRAAGAI